ncbi:HEAT repeat domain-containing protein [Pedobacter miscanthi]|uniref:HEAT repeat domain-containing protein n=1 Tax=Pedobacter miscanthi TaxID=2259170 RepID=A0A366KMP3_9SPHI|nr:HEAT repeat domain-containing protein [Pedobacter miscanthi]RBQ02543.1 hypothetical protein DRW42_26365 [Pedobacter miscanthi]
MNDQIKDFVEQHREEFDHLEAPAFDMGRFKRMQVQAEQPEVKTVKLFTWRKWVAAASIILLAGATWMFFNQQSDVETKNNSIATVQPKNTKKNNVVLAQPDLAKTTTKDVVKPVITKPAIIKEQVQPVKNEGNIYRELKDSSSASVRLLAILKIEKTKQMDNKTLDMLSKTLNSDGNTNVRLAALGVLQKYSSNKYASSLLVNSLNKQDDPMVQLGLVSFLGKMKNVEIGEKLYALANNPETFAAVRDEAYSVLLNQDKL